MTQNSKGWPRFAITLSLAACVFVASAACAPTPAPESVAETPTEEQDLAAIQNLVGNVVHAYNEADAQQMCSLYTEDGMRLPPGAVTLEGRQRICDNLATSFATYDREVTMRQDEARFSKDLAVVRGTWALTQTLKTSGETSHDVGTWFHVLERQPDGGWKISRSIWNSNQPG